MVTRKRRRKSIKIWNLNHQLRQCLQRAPTLCLLRNSQRVQACCLVQMLWLSSQAFPILLALLLRQLMRNPLHTEWAPRVFQLTAGKVPNRLLKSTRIHLMWLSFLRSYRCPTLVAKPHSVSVTQLNRVVVPLPVDSKHTAYTAYTAYTGCPHIPLQAALCRQPVVFLLVHRWRHWLMVPCVIANQWVEGHQHTCGSPQANTSRCRHHHHHHHHKVAHATQVWREPNPTPSRRAGVSRNPLVLNNIYVKYMLITSSNLWFVVWAWLGWLVTKLWSAYLLNEELDCVF